MKSLLASIRDGGGLDRVDHAVQLLEDEWRRHGDVPLERLWKEQKRLLESGAEESIVLLSELIKTDLRCRFARGQAPAVADYLSRFPELDEADSRVLSLIYEEFCLVEERDDRVDVAGFCDRYPRWKDSLASQLRYHHLLSQAAGVRPKAPPFPEAGGAFEEFQLVSLLGRGGTSRVFLARDLSLGGKQVVLKVSLDRGREPQAQGALDHPHIVPVNSVVFGDAGMRGLSMPYRPGLPLDEVIRRVAPASKPPRAMALWEALVRAPEPANDPAPDADAAPTPEVRMAGPRGDGWEGFPVRGTYAQGVAWVVKIIAEALHYAHGQQTFHRDVKPANVLLTVQHGPQLLDFNLAESPHSASQAQAAMHGGTLPYMAPEQIEAFLDPELWGKVGAQADIYSLGLVLREMLTGQAPDLPAETLAPARAMRVLLDRRPLLDVTVRRANPTIPHALEAIVGKCLAVSPADRYADAGALAEDLDRFLHHRPLVHAENPSPRERCANWAVRNRLTLAVVAACLGPFLFLLGWVARGWWTVPRPSGPIENSPDLGVALASLLGRDAKASIEPLERLAELYSESSLPRMYLCLAQDDLREDAAAESRFREVLAMPDARNDLMVRISKDDQLLKKLEHFIDRRIRKANDIGWSVGLAEGDRRDKRIGQLSLAKAACEILLELNPDSDPGFRSLAWCEVELGQAELVLERVNRSMESTGPQPEPGSKEEIDLARRFFRLRGARCLALIKLAEDLRGEGSDPARRKALEHLDAVETDLKRCGQYIDSISKGGRDKHQLAEDRFLAMVPRIEIEIDLGQLGEAARHLRRAKSVLANYRELSMELDKKDRLDSFVSRLQSVEDRLRKTAKRNDSASASSPSMTASAPPRG